MFVVATENLMVIGWTITEILKPLVVQSQIFPKKVSIPEYLFVKEDWC